MRPFVAQYAPGKDVDPDASTRYRPVFRGRSWRSRRRRARSLSAALGFALGDDGRADLTLRTFDGRVGNDGFDFSAGPIDDLDRLQDRQGLAASLRVQKRLGRRWNQIFLVGFNDGLTEGAALALATRSSPVADLSYWSSPVLFVLGDDDRNVLFIQTTDLVRRLRARDVHVETLIFPDEVHGFLRYDSWMRTFRAASDFFDRFLNE